MPVKHVIEDDPSKAIWREYAAEANKEDSILASYPILAEFKVRNHPRKYLNTNDKKTSSLYDIQVIDSFLAPVKTPNFMKDGPNASFNMNKGGSERTDTRPLSNFTDVHKYMAQSKFEDDFSNNALNMMSFFVGSKITYSERGRSDYAGAFITELKEMNRYLVKSNDTIGQILSVRQSVGNSLVQGQELVILQQRNALLEAISDIPSKALAYSSRMRHISPPAASGYPKISIYGQNDDLVADKPPIDNAITIIDGIFSGENSFFNKSLLEYEGKIGQCEEEKKEAQEAQEKAVKDAEEAKRKADTQINEAEEATKQAKKEAEDAKRDAEKEKNEQMREDKEKAEKDKEKELKTLLAVTNEMIRHVNELKTKFLNFGKNYKEHANKILKGEKYGADSWSEYVKIGTKNAGTILGFRHTDNVSEITLHELKDKSIIDNRKTKLDTYINYIKNIITVISLNPYGGSGRTEIVTSNVNELIEQKMDKMKATIDQFKENQKKMDDFKETFLENFITMAVEISGMIYKNLREINVPANKMTEIKKNNLSYTPSGGVKKVTMGSIESFLNSAENKTVANYGDTYKNAYNIFSVFSGAIIPVEDIEEGKLNPVFLDGNYISKVAASVNEHIENLEKAIKKLKEEKAELSIKAGNKPVSKKEEELNELALPQRNSLIKAIKMHFDRILTIYKNMLDRGIETRAKFSIDVTGDKKTQTIEIDENYTNMFGINVTTNDWDKGNGNLANKNFQNALNLLRMISDNQSETDVSILDSIATSLEDLNGASSTIAEFINAINNVLKTTLGKIDPTGVYNFKLDKAVKQYSVPTGYLPMLIRSRPDTLMDYLANTVLQSQLLTGIHARDVVPNVPNLEDGAVFIKAMDQYIDKYEKNETQLKKNREETRTKISTTEYQKFAELSAEKLFTEFKDKKLLGNASKTMKLLAKNGISTSKGEVYNSISQIISEVDNSKDKFNTKLQAAYVKLTNRDFKPTTGKKKKKKISTNEKEEIETKFKEWLTTLTVVVKVKSTIHEHIYETYKKQFKKITKDKAFGSVAEEYEKLKAVYPNDKHIKDFKLRKDKVDAIVDDFSKKTSQKFYLEVQRQLTVLRIYSDHYEIYKEFHDNFKQYIMVNGSGLKIVRDFVKFMQDTLGTTLTSSLALKYRNVVERGSYDKKSAEESVINYDLRTFVFHVDLLESVIIAVQPALSFSISSNILKYNQPGKTTSGANPFGKDSELYQIIGQLHNNPSLFASTHLLPTIYKSVFTDLYKNLVNQMLNTSDIEYTTGKFKSAIVMTRANNLIDEWNKTTTIDKKATDKIFQNASLGHADYILPNLDVAILGQPWSFAGHLLQLIRHPYTVISTVHERIIATMTQRWITLQGMYKNISRLQESSSSTLKEQKEGIKREMTIQQLLTEKEKAYEILSRKFVQVKMKLDSLTYSDPNLLSKVIVIYNNVASVLNRNMSTMANNTQAGQVLDGLVGSFSTLTALSLHLKEINPANIKRNQTQIQYLDEIIQQQTTDRVNLAIQMLMEYNVKSKEGAELKADKTALKALKDKLKSKEDQLKIINQTYKGFVVEDSRLQNIMPYTKFADSSSKLLTFYTTLADIYGTIFQNIDKLDFKSGQPIGVMMLNAFNIKAAKNTTYAKAVSKIPGIARMSSEEIGIFLARYKKDVMDLQNVPVQNMRNIGKDMLDAANYAFDGYQRQQSEAIDQLQKLIKKSEDDPDTEAVKSALRQLAENAEKRNKELRQTNSKLNRDISQIRTDLAKKENEIKKNEEKIRKLEEDQKQKKDKIDELQGTLNVVQEGTPFGQKDSYVKTCAKAKTKVKQLTIEKGSIQDELNKAKSEINKLKGEKKKLEDEISLRDDKSMKVEDLITQRDSQKRQIEKLKLLVRVRTDEQRLDTRAEAVKAKETKQEMKYMDKYYKTLDDYKTSESERAKYLAEKTVLEREKIELEEKVKTLEGVEERLKECQINEIKYRNIISTATAMFDGSDLSTITELYDEPMQSEEAMLTEEEMKVQIKEESKSKKYLSQTLKCEREQTKLIKQLEALKVELQEQKMKIDKLSKKEKQLNTTLSDLDKTQEELKNEKEKLIKKERELSEKDKLIKEYAKNRSKTGVFDSVLKSTNQMEKLRKKLDIATEKLVEDFRGKYQNKKLSELLKEKIEKTNMLLAEHEQQKRKLNQQITFLEGYEDKIREKQSMIDSQKQQVQNLTNLIAQLKSELSNIADYTEGTVSEYQSQVQKQKQDVGILLGTLVQNTTRVQELEAALEECREEQRKLLSEREDLVSYNDDSHYKIGSLEEQLTQIKEEYEKLKLECQKDEKDQENYQTILNIIEQVNTQMHAGDVAFDASQLKSETMTEDKILAELGIVEPSTPGLTEQKVVKKRRVASFGSPAVVSVAPSFTPKPGEGTQTPGEGTQTPGEKRKTAKQKYPTSGNGTPYQIDLHNDNFIEYDIDNDTSEDIVTSSEDIVYNEEDILTSSEDIVYSEEEEQEGEKLSRELKLLFL